MKRKEFVPATILFALFAYTQLSPVAIPTAGAEEAVAPLAVLMSCTGPVTVHHADGATSKGIFGFALKAGDEVKTGDGATAEILFEAGNWLQIGANSSIQIKGQRGAKPPAPAKASEPREPERPKADTEAVAGGETKSFDVVQNFLKLKDSEGTSVVMGLRSGGKDQDLVAISPSQTKIRGGRPTFRWEIADPSTELRLTVYNDTGVYWQDDVSGVTSLTYPADAPELAPGVSYSWTLETTDPLAFPPLRTQAAFFEVIAPQDESALDRSLEQVDADKKLSEPSSHFIKASLYFDHGLLDEAIAETKSALEKYPDNPSLQSILARLYAEAGRNKEAMATYNQMIDRQ